MNIENLKEGQIIKNYKELCTLLGMTQTTGNSKISQLKELERYIVYHKEGNKFVVDEIFSDAKPKQDKRHEGLNKKDYPSLQIPQENQYKNGVYIIQKDNDVYIGSTFSQAGFRGRHGQHLSNGDNHHSKTQSLLQQGAIFKTLFIAEDNNIQDEVLIRMIEEEYIKYYKRYTDYNIVNTHESTFSYTESTKPKIKYKNIKIDENDLEYVLKILEENYVKYQVK